MSKTYNPEECSEAYSNPKCPYVTVINLNSNCLKNVEKSLIALLGPDGTGLNQGVIHDILMKLEQFENNRKITASWINLFKPIAISVLITAITTFLITKFG